MSINGGYSNRRNFLRQQVSLYLGRKGSPNMLTQSKNETKLDGSMAIAMTLGIRRYLIRTI